MSKDKTVNFNQFKLQKHVEETLATALQLANDQPLNAGLIVRAVFVVSQSHKSEAFKKLHELIPISEIDETPPSQKIAPFLDKVELDDNLYDSFLIAEKTWNNENRNIWGRDLITMAILSQNDDSLFELLKEGGIGIDELRKKWYAFVTSSKVPYNPQVWQEWFSMAGITGLETDEPLPEINTYLLGWNPELFKPEELRKTIKRIAENNDAIAGWSTGNRTNVSIGDKVYLMRHGSEKAGLIGFGTIVGEVTQQPHFDPSRRAAGDTYNMAPIKWERLQEEPIIELEELYEKLNETQLWHSQAGGVEIPETLTDNLNKLWKENVRKAFIKLKIKIHSDKTSDAQEDLLGYKNYSASIAEIIKNNDDGEPFNIGIIAPWGHGKTTLMEYIREELEPDFEKNENKENDREFSTKIKQLKNWLSQNIKDIFKFNKISEYHPTVWFNAWKYQSSDQIWAGIGHAIISQLVEKLKVAEQEKFWFKLKSHQLNKQNLQHNIYRYIYQNLPATIISLVLTLLLIVGGIFITNKFDNISGLITIAFGIAPGFWSYKNFHQIYQRINSPVHGMFADTVKTPDYSEKLGLFHQLTEDLQSVFNLLIDPKKPAVIFIDDLDRCSPEVVADVMEAINLIMTNPLVGKHCYFIFGMDAQVVAATLDSKYRNLRGKLPGREHTYGSVGWYFLDKFIQVPFIIPIMQTDEKKNFLGNFFVTTEEETTTPEDEKEIEENNTELKEAIVNKDEEKITRILKSETNKNKKKNLEKTFISERIKQYKEDSEEIIEQLDYLLDYLSSSPREIKRYVNLLTLHNVHQNLRFYKSYEVPQNKEIAKWLLISLKWPQLVRWVQWENEQDLVLINTPESKAKKMDNLVDEFIFQNPVIDKNDPEYFERWLTFLSNENINKKEWLKDKQLFQVLVTSNGQEGKLEKAIRCRIW